MVWYGSPAGCQHTQAHSRSAAAEYCALMQVLTLNGEDESAKSTNTIMPFWSRVPAPSSLSELTRGEHPTRGADPASGTNLAARRLRREEMLVLGGHVD